MVPKRVLVIDPEAASRRLLHLLLTNAGYQVTLAASGQEALDHAATAQHDIVIIDPSLRDTDGLQLCRELRDWSDVPIIAISIDDRESSKVEALELGIDDYITKPFGRGEFVARIRAVLRRTRGEPMSPVLEYGNLRLDQATRRV